MSRIERLIKYFQMPGMTENEKEAAEVLRDMRAQLALAEKVVEAARNVCRPRSKAMLPMAALDGLYNTVVDYNAAYPPKPAREQEMKG